LIDQTLVARLEVAGHFGQGQLLLLRVHPGNSARSLCALVPLRTRFCGGGFAGYLRWCGHSYPRWAGETRLGRSMAITLRARSTGVSHGTGAARRGRGFLISNEIPMNFTTPAARVEWADTAGPKRTDKEGNVPAFALPDVRRSTRLCTRRYAGPRGGCWRRCSSGQG
jgi:hypothetical protein